MSDFSVEELPEHLSDEQACAVNAFENALLLELDPSVAPMPVSMTKAYATHHDPTEVAGAFAARTANGRVVGVAWMTGSTKENKHLSYTRLGVAADWRRRGVGTALLGAYVDFAAKHNRSALMLGADVLHDGATGFAASLGAPVALAAHVNQLELHDLPAGLVEDWLANAAPDYELDWVPDSDRPDEWLDDLCVVSDVLQNDAPMDDVPMGERHATHEQLRAHTERTRAFGREWWTLVVRHRATREPVGYTEIFFAPENPWLASQGATAVSASHRGHALGRWLKAAMVQRLMTERPGIRTIRTFNADSNDPMLAINNAMGFKPLFASHRWITDRENAERWLETR